MTSNPWMKFFPSDWRSDPRLRMCSLAARGLWMEMLMLMHEAVPYGHLLVSGIAPTNAQLAVLAGTTPDQITHLLGELESAAVFSRTSKGVIYSRRMTRDEKKASLARKNGQKGGNPSLCNTTRNPPPDNPHVNGEDKTQKPDTRVQKKEEGGGGGGAGARACEEIAGRVAEKTGLPATDRNVATVEQWLAKGYDPQQDIYPAVVEALPTAKKPIGYFAYFTAAIDRRHAARTAPQPARNPSNVLPIRPAAGQHREPEGRAKGGLAALRCLARELEAGD